MDVNQEVNKTTVKKEDTNNISMIKNIFSQKKTKL